MSRLVLVFLGPPGVGKGTQAVRLAEAMRLPHISTGDLFRDHMKRETDLGLKAREYVNAGKLVPDALVVDLVMDRIQAADCAKGFILDGFPRNVPQQEALARALEVRGDRISAALFFNAPRNVIVERISGRRTCKACGATSHVRFAPTKAEGVCDACGGETWQRPDDAPDKVVERLEVYEKNTGPLVEFYRQAGLLAEIDAERPVNEVFGSTLAAAEKLQG